MGFINTKIKGMDISTLVEEELCGARYYDEGEQQELLSILKKYDTNSVRIRLWNDPYGCEPGQGGTKLSCADCSDSLSSTKSDPSVRLGTNGRYCYGAGTNDFDTAVALARRAKEQGMSVLLDYHYSDFWADPGKQYPPKAWEKKNADELAEAVYEYTFTTLTKFKEMDLLPYMVQVGNEITNGFCWPLGNRHYGRDEQTADATTPYFNPLLKKMLVAGIKAVRAVSGDIIVMLHLDNGGNNALYRDWFDGYFACPEGRGEDDFDVIGLSYYPFWHGNLAALKYNLDDIAVRYGKELVIAEVSMGHSMEDYRRYEMPGEVSAKAMTETDLKGMATREELTKGLDYPMTPQGQLEFMMHLNRIISEIPGGLGRGYYYWEPAWIPVPGCGWASPASLEYIHDKGPCGNEWANQALFDYEGHALPALKIR